ncbi:hypothetical protein Tco_0478622 [Tanacetum coccineum]
MIEMDKTVQASDFMSRRLNKSVQASVINEMTFEHSSSSLGHQCQMASAENNTSGLAPPRQMMSDHNSSDLAPQRQEMSVENVASVPWFLRTKASDYDNSFFLDPAPQGQNVVPTEGKDSFVTSQVRGNPSMPVQTRRQLATDPEMCMFALTIDYKASGYEEQETDEDQDCNFATKHDLLPKGLCSGKKVGSEKTAFLNVPLKEEVYVAKPAEGFVDPDNPRKASDFPKSPKTLDQPDALIRGKKALLGGIQFLVIKLIVDIDRWQSAQLRVLKPNAPMDVLSKRINSKSQHSGVILLVFTMTNGIHSSVIIPTTALRFRFGFQFIPLELYLGYSSLGINLFRGHFCCGNGGINKKRRTEKVEENTFDSIEWQNRNDRYEWNGKSYRSNEVEKAYRFEPSGKRLDFERVEKVKFQLYKQKYDEISKESVNRSQFEGLAPPRQMMSDHNSSDLAPQRQEMSVENVASVPWFLRTKASDYDNSFFLDPAPQGQNVVPTEGKDSFVTSQGLEFSLQYFS